MLILANHAVESEHVEKSLGASVLDTANGYPQSSSPLSLRDFFSTEHSVRAASLAILCTRA